MPIYEYRCTRCGHQFEVTHGVGEATERCEACGGPVRKVFSAVGIIFKGSGFHVTDYRKTPASADGEEKAAGGASKAEPSGAGETSKPGATSGPGEASRPGAAPRSGDSSKAGTGKTGDSSAASSPGAGKRSS